MFNIKKLNEYDTFFTLRKLKKQLIAVEYREYKDFCPNLLHLLFTANIITRCTHQVNIRAGRRLLFLGNDMILFVF